MIGRLAWYSLLAAIAAITVSVQIDRQSAIQPAYAPLTPEPFRGFAQAQLAAIALQSGDADRAVSEARLLVERRPIPAETLRLLAQAQFAAGHQDEGFVTIQVAAQRGWRDPAAQESMLRLALAAGDEAEAARRYTALFLIRSTQDALLQEFGADLFSDVDGPAVAELAKIVAGSNRWRRAFLSRGARVIPRDAFAAIIETAAEQGGAFRCDDLQALAPGIAATVNGCVTEP